MGLVSFFAGLIDFLFNKFTILLIFIGLVVVGAVVSRSSKNKEHKEAERSEAEQLRHYVSDINDEPWSNKGNGDAQAEAADGNSKGKLEFSMTGRPPRGAIPEIIFTKRRGQCWSGQN